MLALHMTLVVNVMGYTLTAAGRPGRSLAVDVVQTVVSAGGDLLLIRPLGALGSAVAAMAATYVSNPAAAWLVRRSEIPFALAPYAKQTLIVLLCAALSWWAQPAGIVYKAAILALFVGLSLLASTISPDDVRLLTGSRFRRSDTVPQPLAAPIPVAAGNER
jgi:Na+-driven multidrug efflux pump